MSAKEFGPYLTRVWGPILRGAEGREGEVLKFVEQRAGPVGPPQEKQEKCGGLLERQRKFRENNKKK